MAMCDDIRRALKLAGAERISEEIATKCSALAKTCHLSPAQMGECWEAFMINKSVKELTEYTYESYRLEVIKNAGKLSDVGDKAPDSSSATRQSSVVGKRSSTDRRVNLVTPPSKRASIDKISSMSAVDRVVTDSLLSPKVASGPLYDDRTGAGKVVVLYDPQSLDKSPKEQHNTSSASHRCEISYSFNTNIQKPYRHMFTSLEEKAKALDKHIVELGEEIQRHHGISNDEDGDNGIAPLESVGVPRQDKICCIGRVCNSAHQGRINQTSVVLEGPRHSSGGVRVDLDLSYIQDQKIPFSLFPGQIVAVEGMNTTGYKMVPHRIFEGAAHEPQKSTVRDLMKYHYDKEYQDGAPLKIMSVCGPYTTSENLDYQPLFDFIQTCVMSEEPDVVVMIGPFVDLRHKDVENGNTFVQFANGEQTVVSYEEFFAQKITSLLTEVFESSEIKTQFVLVPSLDDATSKWHYPQAPFSDRLDGGRKDLPGSEGIEMGTHGLGNVEKFGKRSRRTRRVHCVSNPCTLKVNEIVIGVSGVDTLFNISSDETNANLEFGSRLVRISQHMLQQQSYYPLFPSKVNLDWKYADQWKMPCRPDILIAPSKLTNFAKPVLKNTLVVNPGYLSRGATGGTYATMNVYPMKRELLENANGDSVELEHGVPNRIQVKIRRI